MQTISNAMAGFFNRLGSVFTTVRPADILDVLIVAYLIYHAIRLVRETRAMQLVKGIGMVIILYIAAINLKMITLTFLIQTILQWGIVAVAIVFQPELRRALEQVGRSKIPGIGKLGAEVDPNAPTGIQATIDAITESAATLSASRTGALIVIERETKLGDVIPTGTIVDSTPSVQLICNIFYPNTPLHDGAMIIRENRIYAAGCFLPLSANSEIGRELGTRHRAALGMSEVSDAIIVVVSEETGAISVALDGKLQRRLSAQNLGKLLGAKLIGSQDGEGDSKSKMQRLAFWRKPK